MKYKTHIVFLDCEREQENDDSILESIQNCYFVSREHLQRKISDRMIVFTVKEFVERYNSDQISSYSSKISAVNIREKNEN